MVITPMAPMTAEYGNQWNTHARSRAYHSTAVLLPDATVLVAGGDWMSNEIPQPPAVEPPEEPLPPAGNPENERDGHEDAQIFYPPYFFNADADRSWIAERPVITSPGDRASLGYGATINIGTAPGQAQYIERVTLVALSSVTHCFNSGQRFNRLTIGNVDTENDIVPVTTPADANVCPPGYYMLFIHWRNGANGGRFVPSVARIIQIR